MKHYVEIPSPRSCIWLSISRKISPCPKRCAFIRPTVLNLITLTRFTIMISIKPTTNYDTSILFLLISGYTSAARNRNVFFLSFFLFNSLIGSTIKCPSTHRYPSLLPLIIYKILFLNLLNKFRFIEDCLVLPLLVYPSIIDVANVLFLEMRPINFFVLSLIVVHTDRLYFIVLYTSSLDTRSARGIIFQHRISNDFIIFQSHLGLPITPLRTML